MSSNLLVAAGIVIFRRIHNEIEYLLLKASYGDFHWSPPKGHVDPGESEIETAWRETKEECGLDKSDLKIFDKFRKTLKYEVRGNPKRVEYWLAELNNCDSKVVLSDEHTEYKWLGLQEALEYAKYETMKETLSDAQKFLSKL